ncbi:hypothetical protein [Jeotgalibacillus haloalkalitolerans]|uniref:REase associating with pPIWI RE domain-containing protein n=1 Tax=Jeotgalibacillus haloalkalitolerans TaxID=3104292 RepID=A0ABU5KJD2_9BACL|nr:hypothetical protein [Jeotgalibacillus sp. HH7-29]MDZ5711351.1 hypothetical protein [Jeotgalibacillus sp. HH7-29]
MNQDELFRELINAVILFEKCDESALNNLINVHEVLLLNEPDRIPHMLTDFVQLLSEKPMIGFKSFSDIQLPVLLDIASSPLVSGKEIEKALEEWDLKNSSAVFTGLEADQRVMRDILFECRDMKNQKAAQEIYTRIRLFVYNPAFVKSHLRAKPFANVVTEKQLDDFINMLATEYDLLPTIPRKIKQLYEKVELSNAMTVCPVCYRIRTGLNICTDDSVCFSSKQKNMMSPVMLVEDILANNPEVRIKSDIENETFLQPRAGIFKFSILPGLSEWRIAKKLKRRLPLELLLFPDLEMKGDIKITYRGASLYVDVKDQRDPLKLGQSLRAQGNRLPVIVITSNRTANNRSYMELLKRELPNAVLLREKELIPYVIEYFHLPGRLVKS